MAPINQIRPMSLCDRIFHWIETFWYNWRVTIWEGEISSHLPKGQMKDVQSREMVIQRIFNALFLGDCLCVKEKMTKVRDLVERACPIALPLPEPEEEKEAPIPVPPPKKPPVDYYAPSVITNPFVRSMITQSFQAAQAAYSYFYPPKPEPIVPVAVPRPRQPVGPKEEIRKALKQLFISSEVTEFADILTDNLIPPNIVEFRATDTYRELASGGKKLIKKDFEIILDREQATHLGDQGAQYLANSLAPYGFISATEWALKLPTMKTEKKIVGSINYAETKLEYNAGCVTGEAPHNFPDWALRHFDVPRRGTTLSLQFNPMQDKLTITTGDLDNLDKEKRVKEWDFESFKNTFGDLTWPNNQ